MGQKQTRFSKTIPDEWALLRLALRTNHRQELIDHQAAQEQAKFHLDQRHQQEMAQISVVFNPLGWVQAITRYQSQQTHDQLIHQAIRSLTLTRQRMESVQLEQWITQQQQQASDVLLFDQLHRLFGWSLSQAQQQSFYQSLSQGYTLLVTDVQKQILWASNNFIALTGYPLQEVVGQSARLLQGPATDQATVQYVREQLSAMQPLEVELVNYTKSGDTYLCHMRIEPLYNHQGLLTHFLAIERAVAPRI